MKVLVACEYSGRVRDAFIALGHEAISCDLLPTDSPGPHYEGDVFDLLDNTYDLIIAHPPCTCLCVSGNSTYGATQDRYQERLDAVRWTKLLWDKCVLSAKSVCFENPVGVLKRLGGLPQANYIQPWQFGHMEQKKTGLHLHNLPALRETNNVYDKMMQLPKNVRERMHYMQPSKDRWKLRSTTYQGIANAMAEQWG